MAVFSITMAVLAICAYCFFIKVVIMPQCTFAPLAVITASICLFCCFGYANMLFIGGVLWYALAAVAFVAALFKAKKENIKKVSAFFTTDILIFLALSIFIVIALACTQPLFLRWDEFSFWGSAAKAVKTSGSLYTFGAYGLTGRLAYPCALPCLCYIFQFFNTAFCEWAALAAYDIMFFAVFAAIIGVFTNKQRNNAIIISAVLFLTVFIFESQGAAFQTVYAYRSMLSEMPLGALFAGSLAIYFTQKQKTLFTLTSFAICLAALALVKDVGFVFACIAVFIAFADLLFVQRKSFKIGKVKGALAVLLCACVLLAICAGAFFSWNMHVAAATGADRTAGDGAAGLGMAGVLINGFKELVGIGTTQRFTAIFKSMILAFFKIKVSVLGPGALIAAVIVAILLLSFFCSKNKDIKKSIIVFFITGFIGLAGMMLFQLFAYVYVFAPAPGLDLLDYGRYMSAYYLGFFITSVCILCTAISQLDAKKIGGIASVCLLFVMLCASFITIKPQNTFLQMSPTVSTDRDMLNIRASKAVEICGEGDNIYMVSQGDNSQRFYKYAFITMPATVVKPICNIFVQPNDTEALKQDGAKPVTINDFKKYLKDNNCKYVLLDETDEYFELEFKPMFSDGMSKFYNEETRLYSVKTINGEVMLYPCDRGEE